MKFQIIGDEINNKYNSIIVEDTILVEAPNGVLNNLIKSNIILNNIQAIIITNLNEESYIDLPLILQNEFYNNREEELYIIGPKKLPKRISKLIKKSLNINPKTIYSKIKVIFLDVELIQDKQILSGSHLTFVNTNNYKRKNTYGFILKKDNKSLGYTGMSPFSPGVSYILKKSTHTILPISESKKRINVEKIINIKKDFNTIYIPVNLNENMFNILKNETNIKALLLGENFWL